MKISLAPEGHFFLENMNTKELNESGDDLNFTVTYCGADVPLKSVCDTGKHGGEP